MPNSKSVAHIILRVTSPMLHPIFESFSGVMLGLAPFWRYFDDMLVHTVGSRARLRSTDYSDMVVPRSCTVHFGQRSFHSSAPSVWNDLPSELKNSDTSTGF